MTIRSLAQVTAGVTAGVLAGAALVGIPTWASAGPDDTARPSRSEMSSMMTGKQSHEQMVDSMSTMMGDPTMRKQMRSLMSGAMGDMSGMDGMKSAHSHSGMDQMHPMTRGSK